MKQKVATPVVVIAILVVVGLIALFGRSYLSEPKAVSTPPPSFIDPATGRPKGQMTGSGVAQPQRNTGSPFSAPGGAAPGGGAPR